MRQSLDDLPILNTSIAFSNNPFIFKFLFILSLTSVKLLLEEIFVSSVLVNKILLVVEPIFEVISVIFSSPSLYMFLLLFISLLFFSTNKFKL